MMRAKTDDEAPPLIGKGCVFLDLSNSMKNSELSLKSLLFVSVLGTRRGPSRDHVLDHVLDLTPDLALLKNVTEGVEGERDDCLCS